MSERHPSQNLDKGPVRPERIYRLVRDYETEMPDLNSVCGEKN